MSGDLAGLRRTVVVAVVVAIVGSVALSETFDRLFERHVIWFLQHFTVTSLLTAAAYVALGLVVVLVCRRLAAGHGVPPRVAWGVGIALAAFAFAVAASSVAYALVFRTDAIGSLSVLRWFQYVAPLTMALIGLVGLRIAGVVPWRALVGGVALGGLLYASDRFDVPLLSGMVTDDLGRSLYGALKYGAVQGLAALLTVRLVELEREPVRV